MLVPTYDERMDALRKECEQGFRTAEVIQPTRSYREVVTAFAAGELVKELFTKTYTHHTLWGDGVKAEGEAGMYVETPEQAIADFRRGWLEIREDMPGDELLWRLPPKLHHWQDPSTADEGWVVRARFTIIDRAAVREEARAWYAERGIELPEELAPVDVTPTIENHLGDIQIGEWLEDARNYSCTGCGEQCSPSVGKWRWNGTTWEHQCGDPQAGYTVAERVEPVVLDDDEVSYREVHTPVVAGPTGAVVPGADSLAEEVQRERTSEAFVQAFDAEMSREAGE